MLKSWFTKRKRPASTFQPVSTDQILYVIGDVHGRADLLSAALEQLPDDGQIICVGDYVDRGEESAQVLRILEHRSDVVCLRGNHEEMLLSFLKDPEKSGPSWLRYGGLQTLASFGVKSVSEASKGRDLRVARDALAEVMGESQIAWLNKLPLTYQSGNVGVVHAGADPEVPLDKQQSRDLLWGHSKFRETLRSDGLWIAHGHTIVNEPVAQDGVISVDTGAYATGRLTVAMISDEGVEFSSPSL